MNIKMKIFIVSSIIGICLFVVFVFLLFRGNQSTPASPSQLPVPTSVLLQKISPKSNSFSPFGRTTIGTTTKSDVEKLPNILTTQTLPDGTTEYSIKSVSVFHPDEILVKDNKVFFEKTTTFTNNKGGLPHITDYTAVYGQAEEVIQGSKAYGAFTTTLLYPQKGFALIGNETTDNVYEILRFTPMSLEDFKANFGTFIESTSPAAE